MVNILISFVATIFDILPNTYIYIYILPIGCETIKYDMSYFVMKWSITFYPRLNDYEVLLVVASSINYDQTWWEHLQETPMIDDYTPGFSANFPMNQPIVSHGGSLQL